MRQGQVIRSDQVYEYISCLKNLKKVFITNLYNYEKMEYDIKYKASFLEYEEECYLNLYCEDDGFYRLFFCIADLDAYQVNGIGKKVVCDVFVTYEDENFRKLADKLYRCNFLQYACLEKWVLHSPGKFPRVSSAGYVFDNEKRNEIVDMVFEIFDKYTEYLPRRCEVEMFLQERKFINAYEAKEHRYVGSLIYTEKKRMATLDFYFIREEVRGKKLSYLLHDQFYQLLPQEEYKIISYINKKNLISIAVHQKYGYKKEQFRKYTFLCNGI